MIFRNLHAEKLARKIGKLERKKKMALIEKLKPNYKFKWEHENFPTDACVNVHINHAMNGFCGSIELVLSPL